MLDCRLRHQLKLKLSGQCLERAIKRLQPFRHWLIDLRPIDTLLAAIRTLSLRPQLFQAPFRRLLWLRTTPQISSSEHVTCATGWNKWKMIQILHRLTWDSRQLFKKEASLYLKNWRANFNEIYILLLWIPTHLPINLVSASTFSYFQSLSKDRWETSVVNKKRRTKYTSRRKWKVLLIFLIKKRELS